MKHYDVINKITGEVLSGDDTLDRNSALMHAAKWADDNGYDSIRVVDNPSKGVPPYVEVSSKEYERQLK